MNKIQFSNEFGDNIFPVYNSDFKNYYFDNGQWYYNPIEIEMRYKVECSKVVRYDKNEIKCKNI